MVELRADTIKDFNSDDISLVKESVKTSSIFTFRHKKEGGLYAGALSKQKEILKKAFASGFTYVDIAYNNSLTGKLSIKEKTQLLLSYHNNDETPPIEELEDILNTMRSVHPAIIKMATFVNNPKDITILATLLERKKKNEKLIVIGIGIKGEITRFLFPLMGSCIAYVTMKGDKNIAPGMLTDADMKPISEYFKKQHHAR